MLLDPEPRSSDTSKEVHDDATANRGIVVVTVAGIVTGILLSLARISGETAPLLFTAFGNQYWNTDIMRPMASVPVVMYQYAGSPYESWQQLAWAGALVLTVFVLVVSIGARALLLRKRISHD